MCASSEYIKQMQEKQAIEIIIGNQNLPHKEIILLIEEKSSITLEYAIDLFNKFKHLIPSFYLTTIINKQQMIKVFTSGEDPKRAGNDLTNQFDVWVTGLDHYIEIIATHSNSNRWGWMLVVTYRKGDSKS